jgi:hypothetical protein
MSLAINEEYGWWKRTAVGTSDATAPESPAKKHAVQDKHVCRLKGQLGLQVTPDCRVEPQVI